MSIRIEYNAVMKLSAQEEYGLRCLLHMASKGDNASHSIPEISRAEGLSIPNVAKLMRILRMGGYVASARGQSGGYTLARPSTEIHVGPVLELLGGRLCGPSFCNRHAGLLAECTHLRDCSLRPLWQTLQAAMEHVLRNLTLHDLVRDEAAMRSKLSQHVRIDTFPANGSAASGIAPSLVQSEECHG
jgi:Rrf2 family protein